MAFLMLMKVMLLVVLVLVMLLLAAQVEVGLLDGKADVRRRAWHGRIVWIVARRHLGIYLCVVWGLLCVSGVVVVVVVVLVLMAVLVIVGGREGQRRADRQRLDRGRRPVLAREHHGGDGAGGRAADSPSAGW